MAINICLLGLSQLGFGLNQTRSNSLLMPDSSSRIVSQEMKKRQVVVRKDESSWGNGSSSNSSLTIRSVRYAECQKNHAANIGGYAVDGCREFLASGDDGTTAALTCAACGCHRSFHRREVRTEVVSDSSSADHT